MPDYDETRLDETNMKPDTHFSMLAAGNGGVFGLSPIKSVQYVMSMTHNMC